MRKLIAAVLFIALICSAVSCGQKNTEDDNIDVSVYDELIGRIYEEIAAGHILGSELEGIYSLSVGLGHLNAREILEAAGYAAEDINGDGVPELILGMVTEQDGNQAKGDIIYTLYTYSDGKPVLVFESFVRSCYRWIGDGRFYYNGSGSAANYGMGTFCLPKHGTVMECEEFWFTDIKPGTDSEIGYYHNTSGSWMPEKSEELSIAEEEFWAVETEGLEQVRDVVFTQFINYEKAETIDFIDFWAEKSESTHLAAAAYLGCTDGELTSFRTYAQESGILKKYPFIGNIDEDHTVLLDGAEWYVFVPDEDVKIMVDEAVFMEETGTVQPGEEPLLSGAAKPVLIRCNVSEIIPNVMVGIWKNDEMSASYTPQLSMKDGSLTKSEYVFDFTPYECLSHYLLEVITDPDDAEYIYYSNRGEIISDPVWGSESADPVLLKALKDGLTVKVQMGDDETTLAERTLDEGEVLFLRMELLDEDPELQVSAVYEKERQEGIWTAITDNGEKHYRELICG